MEVKGRYTFDAPLARVWEVLMDPVLVCACLPGCQELRPSGDDRFEAILTVSVSLITGTYRGTIAIVDKVPQQSYRLLVEGSGGPGFVRGQSTITLSEADGRTLVEVAGDVQVGGAVARVGQRLLGGASKMMMDRFFSCLHGKARVISGAT